MFDENTTNEDIEILSRMIAGNIRNKVLERIHQHITDDEMGPLQDSIRGCIYNVLNAIRVTDEPRAGFEVYRNFLAELELYPIDTTQYEIEEMIRIVRGEPYQHPLQQRKDVKTQEYESALKRRDKTFSRRGAFSPEEE